MQEADSDRIRRILASLGVGEAESLEHAQIALLNGCVVRDTAEAKAASQLRAFIHWKQQDPTRIVGVVGCFAALHNEQKWVDFIVKPEDYGQLPEVLAHTLHREDLAAQAAEAGIAPSHPVKAFLPVIYGCNYNCTFCIVPQVRGRERSVPVDEVIAQASALAAKGCKEVTLLGQNILSYGRDWDYATKKQNGVLHRHPFSVLLEKVSEVEGIRRIRFVTSHPLDVRHELLLTMARLEKVMPYLHLPIQSGDNDILHAMKRHYTREYYLNLVREIREILPDCALSTDIIVGFPGETEQQFQQTLDLVREVAFDHAFTFRYSIRSNTEAAKMAQVPEEIKKERLARLNALVDQMTASRSTRYVGTVQEVLVEQRENGTFMGKTPANCTVKAEGKAQVGEIVPVRILRARHRRLEGIAFRSQ